jgi:RND superfamily putative drug exporter
VSAATQPDREPFLARVGRFCHDRRRWVLGGWLLVLLVVGGVSGTSGSGFSTEFSLPDVESATGFDILERDFGGQGAGLSGTLVFAADQGVDDPTVKAGMEALFADLENLQPPLPPIRVTSPYAEGEQRRIASQGDGAGKIAYADLELPGDVNQEKAVEIRAAIDDAIEEHVAGIEGLRVEVGGQVFAEFEPPNSEALGLGFAIVILIIAFGSVMAMGLPIGTALMGIFVGVSLTTVLSHIIEMPQFTTFIAVMIGLGVGIDYALFIVTRYREEIHEGRSEADATAIAINTAGRAVLFAGTTVVISLLGMLIMGLAFVNGLAIGSAVVVFVTMIASVTLLPALLGFAGPRVEVTRWRGLIAAGLVAVGLVGAGLNLTPLMFAVPRAVVVIVAGFFVPALKREVPRRAPKPVERTFAYRWSRLIQRRAWPAVVFGVVLLVVLAIPVLSLRLGFSDEGNYPEESTTRQAYDLLAEGFGPGFNGPFILVAELPSGADQAAVMATTAAVTEAVGADPEVAFASPGIPNSMDAPTAVQWFVIPQHSPQAAETADLVARLRTSVLPAVEGDLDVVVTGGVAVNVDFSDYLASRLPYFLAAVLTLSFLLLMVVFRSILVPLKAVIMNLLALAAAYGCVVAVFQWGWLAPVLSVQSTGPVEPFIPMMLFAIVFGLSMDYEVFLLSRVKEEYDGGSPNDKAVADGLASTARVITAAAAIMVFVFGSFLLEADRVVKLMGFGLAIAVLLDATVVRMLLVPASMELLGDRNWWFPRWLDRILPKIDVDGAHHEALINLAADEAAARVDVGDDDPDRESVGAS